ncbi:type II toxin-antitoxin system RelE/ParE family toxin [Croceimicrobium hydrocarbonivorans]|uniref:Uncharacterized protein n=1 Tax=Croceimicrobium hydrocarbonivorans TaxID=2761580 RepID=A0A7H0VA48_9FLAO|nr:hypothetical protein [Croceimicrobium hydrocarbonivorans]QNR22596.1 hypothetical protein H4K34_09360 [Croceimicrobium hydrocarbonivorans]
MSEFSLILSQNVDPNTKIQVFELCKNGENLFELFYDKVNEDGNLVDDLFGALRIIEDTSNRKLLPKKKFRSIIDKKLPYKLYEAKKGSIRIYLMHEENKGRVIITGGAKTKQNRDIKRAKNLIRAYYESQE